MRKRTGRAGLLLALCCPLALAAAAQEPGPAPGETINLSTNPAEDRAPAWSPDGTRLLFESDRDGNREIYMMLADGSGVVRLTHDAGADGQPAWSPDGRRFVFHSTRDGGAGLWVQDLTGGDPMFLLADSSPELTPDWSPDGSRIAFTSMRSGNLHLWSVPAEGGEPMQLTTGEFRDVWPRWSPDGAQILFFSRRDTAGEHDQLYAMDWASRDVRRLTHQPTHHHFTPDWAPDGRRMVTAISDSATDRALVIFDLEGKPEARFGEGHAGVFQPVWSPDGGHIAYAARLEEGEAAELFLYRLPTR